MMRQLSQDRMRTDTIIIGGGQAGLAMGYYLARQGREFTILDAGERVGDAWRGRWDSLTLFTPARYSALARNALSRRAGGVSGQGRGRGLP
jgi:cation diffusion facilitator CzcD-associated flavoprotein CzcO